MINQSTLRISASFACLAVFVIFMAQWLGYIPDEGQLVRNSRAVLSEALAVQFSINVQQQQKGSLPAIMKAVVERNPDIKAIALTTLNNELVARYGDDINSKNEQSTIDYMVVPIFYDNEKWGVLQVSFTPLLRPWWKFVDSTLYQLLIFVGIISFIFYLLLIRKMLVHIDPNKAVPDRVKKALNGFTEGAVIIDDRGAVVLTNQSFETRIDLHSTKLIGKKLSNLAWSHAETSQNHDAPLPWELALKGNKRRNHATLHFQKTETEILTMVANSTPIYDNKHQLRGALVSFSDVTELEKMNRELESMSHFLRHEMNNALSGATSTIALLEKSTQLNETDKRLLSRASQSHRVIGHLLDSVNKANTIEASFAEETSNPIRIDEIVSDSVSRYSTMFDESEFTYQSDNQPIVILGQEERIVQMLDKLATNAVDHGDKHAPVVFSCHKQESRVIISIKSQGAALPENKLAIFDLFASFSQDAVTNQNQGIGLYVVKLIAEGYGGRVSAHDRKDVTGAEFIIELPLAE